MLEPILERTVAALAGGVVAEQECWRLVQALHSWRCAHANLGRLPSLPSKEPSLPE